MHLTTLNPDLRKKLRNLFQGYVEHCEFSPHLTARIDFPLYYMGFKYGAPAFTHHGPGQAGEDRPVIGMIGWNTPATQLPARVLLEFIEILTQHPRLAHHSVLRMLPVANPVALELDEDAPGREDWDLLAHLADQFKQQAADGWIEVHATDSKDFTLSGEISPALYRALVKSKVAASFRERLGVRFPKAANLRPVHRDERWQVQLQVPREWEISHEIRAVSRFLARLVHAQARIAQRESKTARR